MTVTAATVRELMLAGLEGEALVAALERIEAASALAMTARQRSNHKYYESRRAELQERARERKARLKPSETALKPSEPSETRLKPSETGEAAGGEKMSPKNNNQTPKTSPSANASGEGAAPDGALSPAEAGSDDGSTKRKPRKPETLIDPNRKPDDADRAFVAERGMPPAVARNEWVKFVAHHAAKGTLMRDWNAAWRTWVMRWQESQPPPGQITPKKSVQTAARDLLAQFRQGAHDEPFLALPSRNRA